MSRLLRLARARLLWARGTRIVQMYPPRAPIAGLVDRLMDLRLELRVRLVPRGEA